jgi:YidC/Oxa1 family membrane protein insertase
MPKLGCLPLLVQLPIWLALYHLLSKAAGGTPVGALDADLVASMRQAALFGVPLASRGYGGGGVEHLLVVVGMAAVAAALAYVTQKFLVAPNTSTEGMPETMAQVQRLMPVVSAGGMLVAGGAVPLALLAYWVCNSTWTMAQTAVVTRWFPTPGTRAAARLGAERAA